MDPFLSAIDRQFDLIDSKTRLVLEMISDQDLYAMPRELPGSMAMFSCGEYILRSAAMVEKTFGGITTRLWDDPFEWTLPEKLFDIAGVLRYLNEVERTRVRGMQFFTSDDDLKKEMPAPVQIRPIFDILLDTIWHSAHYQGRAFAVFQMISNEKLPRL